MVFSAPLFAVVAVEHDLAHVVVDTRHLHVLKRHPVQLAQILLDLVLGEVLAASEFELVGFQRLVSSG